jgi:hypothetical protein
LVAVLVAVGAGKWHLSVQLGADINNDRTRLKALTEGLFAGSVASLRS